MDDKFFEINKISSFILSNEEIEDKVNEILELSINLVADELYDSYCEDFSKEKLETYHKFLERADNIDFHQMFHAVLYYTETPLDTMQLMQLIYDKDMSVPYHRDPIKSFYREILDKSFIKVIRMDFALSQTSTKEEDWYQRKL